MPFTLGFSLRANFYMIRENHVYVVNVVVINLTWKTMTMNVISRPLSAVVKFNAIAKIHKYRRLHEAHHFIPMAMEAHDIFGHDMDHFIR